MVLGCWALTVAIATGARQAAARRFGGRAPGLRQVLRAQLAGTALNRVVPGGGGLVLAHLDLLERSGACSRRSAGALCGYAAGGAVGHAALLTAALSLLAEGAVGQPGAASWPSLTAVVLPGSLVAAGVLAALGLAARRMRRLRARLRRLRQVGRDVLAAVLARPVDVAVLAVAQVSSTLVAGLGLYAALLATGSRPPLLGVLVALVLAGGLAGLLPVPGGLGTLEAGLIGALGVLGVRIPAAAAAVALFRLVTFWLPIPVGVLAGAPALRCRLRSGRDRLAARRAPAATPA